MKKRFESPEIEIYQINLQDIICTSNGLGIGDIIIDDGENTDETEGF